MLYTRFRARRRLTAIGAALCLTGSVLTFSRPAAAAAPPEPAMSAAFALPTAPPVGAVPLFTGDPAQIGANFYKRYAPATPAAWTVDKNGVATPDGNDITSRQEFGDCIVHAEFLIPGDAQGKAIGRHGGNGGVALQGRYEVQIFDSYGKKATAEGAGAFYSQKAPLVNASKPVGQWQTYDIIFRAPRFDADGKVTEKPRATVFLNGILVQNNEEFNGMTGIQYGEYKTMTKTGPVVLQGNHDLIPMRNIWIVPLASKP